MEKMRFVSVMGDSISTYEGYVPPRYAVFYEGETAARNGLSSVYDVWWARVNQGLHAWLCVDNAYSGSRVTGERFPSAGSAVRTSALHTADASPDVILIYMGVNDFGYSVPITEDSVRTGPGFYGAYLDMLRRIRANYPKAVIVCGTLMKTCIRNRPQWTCPENASGDTLEEYNTAIRIAARTAGVFLADLASLHWKYETLDGTHPTREGHETLARAWLGCLRLIPDEEARKKIWGAPEGAF